ncbi:MAG TPA: hypothetical protein VFS44_09165 [Gemmatimonadaceae bacterium]|nr:hypothetical protein [Gemmatimonadaceae bacterium]
MRSRYLGPGVAVLGGVLALAALVAPAAAQTRFEWPDTAVQVGKYTTVDNCLAAVSRVWRRTKQRESLVVWTDTMPRNPRAELEPLPAPVKETAVRCAARFAEPTASLSDFAPLLALYLDAGRDSDATKLLARRLAAVPAKSTRERAAVGDTAVDVYLSARPVRLDEAERILVERARSGSDRVARLELYSRLMNAARDAGDTTRARRAAQWIVAVADSLTKAERESEAWDKLAGGNGGKLLIFGAMQELMGLPMMLDSLRHGTAALAALERNMWAQVTGERPEALPLPVGERAPTITADYWFPHEAAATPRPAPGHISMVLLMDHAGCLHVDLTGYVGDQCTSLVYGLRRVSERYPQLQITIVDQTAGSYLYLPPPTPADEAELARKWIDAHRIPGAVLAVTNTPHWNLPNPDGRRIDKDTPNMTAYSFGKSWKPSGIFLVDQDGLIVSALAFDEVQIGKFIEVLMQRQTAGGNRAAK